MSVIRVGSSEVSGQITSSDSDNVARSGLCYATTPQYAAKLTIDVGQARSQAIRIETTLTSGYDRRMRYGFMNSDDLLAMVAGLTTGRTVNVRELALKLSSIVTPSDPLEAARLAWESVKRDWREEWPRPVGIDPLVHGGADGERVLRITVTVRPESEAHRARYRTDIEIALVDALRSLGVGLDLALAIDYDVTIIAE